MEFENNIYFWQKLDTLVLSSDKTVTRKKGTPHPDYPNLVYPVDYGFLNDAFSSEDVGVEFFKGTKPSGQVNALIIAVDILRKDIETKVLINCSNEEQDEILHFMNKTDIQKTIIVRRGNSIPDWTESD